jgi:hypothetical protein
VFVQVEMEGNSSAYVSSKLYNLVDTQTHRVKKAARGAQIRAHNLDLLQHGSYLEAIMRPETFAEYLGERGLKVIGKGLLGTADGDGVGEEARVAALARGRLYHQWQERREEARLISLGIQPRLHPLLAKNMLITKNSDNVLVSIVAHKSLMTGLHAKRILLPGSFETCPLAETAAMQVPKE